MQVVSFSNEAVSTCKRYYRDRSADTGASRYISRYTELLRCLRDKVEQNYPQPITKEQKGLLDLAEETLDASVKLEAELSKITSKQGSVTGASWNFIKRAWNKQRIEDLEKDVHRMTTAMEMGLLSRIWYELSIIILGPISWWKY